MIDYKGKIVEIDKKERLSKKAKAKGVTEEVAEEAVRLYFEDGDLTVIECVERAELVYGEKLNKKDIY